MSAFESHSIENDCFTCEACNCKRDTAFHIALPCFLQFPTAPYRFLLFPVLPTVYYPILALLAAYYHSFYHFS
jgi:hypothetical protein